MRIRIRRLSAALLTTAGLVAAGLSQPAPAAAATLACRAVMVDATPTPATAPVLRITTSAGAAVSAVTHFRQGDVTSTATAGTTGAARMVLSAKGLPGVRVVVDVKVRKGAAGATCRTSFTPGGVPGSVSAAVPGGTVPGGVQATAGAARTATSTASTGARSAAAVVDPWGGVVTMQLNCYSGDHSMEYGATTSYASYYRAYRLWIYDYQQDRWEAMTAWTPPFTGTHNTAYRVHPSLDGWYGGYVELAVWTDFGDHQDWTFYGDYASHTQQGWAGSGSFPSAYPGRACYASW